MRISNGLAWLACGLAIVCLGCLPAEDPPVSNTTVLDELDDHAGHDHSQEGPHGGQIVMLGDEAYHVEWLHDDASGKVTVYLLDAAAAEEVRITAEELTVQWTIGDATRQQVLKAVDMGSDDPPTSSQFEVADKSLMEALKTAGQGVEATITAEIDGTPYKGIFERHAHGHDH